MLNPYNICFTNSYVLRLFLHWVKWLPEVVQWQHNNKISKKAHEGISLKKKWGKSCHYNIFLLPQNKTCWQLWEMLYKKNKPCCRHHCLTYWVVLFYIERVMKEHRTHYNRAPIKTRCPSKLLQARWLDRNDENTLFVVFAIPQPKSKAKNLKVIKQLEIVRKDSHTHMQT